MLRAVILTTSHCALEAACQARRCCTGLGWPTPPAQGSQDSLTTSHRRTLHFFRKKRTSKFQKKEMVKSQSPQKRFLQLSFCAIPLASATTERACVPSPNKQTHTLSMAFFSSVVMGGIHRSFALGGARHASATVSANAFPRAYRRDGEERRGKHPKYLFDQQLLSCIIIPLCPR